MEKHEKKVMLNSPKGNNKQYALFFYILITKHIQ